MSESNVLLDEEVLTDPKIQALLLTVLVRRLKPSEDDRIFPLLVSDYLLAGCSPGNPGQILHG